MAGWVMARGRCSGDCCWHCLGRWMRRWDTGGRVGDACGRGERYWPRINRSPCPPEARAAPRQPQTTHPSPAAYFHRPGPLRKYINFVVARPRAGCSLKLSASINMRGWRTRLSPFSSTPSSLAPPPPPPATTASSVHHWTLPTMPLVWRRSPRPHVATVGSGLGPTTGYRGGGEGPLTPGQLISVQGPRSWITKLHYLNPMNRSILSLTLISPKWNGWRTCWHVGQKSTALIQAPLSGGQRAPRPHLISRVGGELPTPHRQIGDLWTVQRFEYSL